MWGGVAAPYSPPIIAMGEKGMTVADDEGNPARPLVLNDLPLWELSEVLLERRRVEFGGNDDDHLRGRRHCGRRSSRWRRWWRLKTLLLLRSLQILWRQWIFLVFPAQCQGSSKEELMVKSASRRIF